jgi:hypothetical protein
MKKFITSRNDFRQGSFTPNTELANLEGYYENSLIVREDYWKWYTFLVKGNILPLNALSGHWSIVNGGTSWRVLFVVC